MEIEVVITATTEVEADLAVTPLEGRRPDPAGARRYQFIFSDDLVLARIDDKVPGNGLPDLLQDRLAGTHSGIATPLRVADADDPFFPDGAMVFQYGGTFVFDSVIAELPVGLPRGQVIARGVAVFDRHFEPLIPPTFAIVGGTGPFTGASGQVRQSKGDGKIRTLEILLPPLAAPHLPS